MRLIAIKPMRYKTRRLEAGDEFEEADMKGRLLVAARLARYAPEPAQDPPAARVQEPAAASVVPSPVSHETSEPPETEVQHYSDASVTIQNLRAEAERLGIAVDGRWGTVRLQAEIARAKL